MPSFSKLVAAVAVGALSLVDAKACPPLGAVFPAPQAPGESKLVQTAATKLKAGLEERITSKFNTSAISIGVKSIHEDDPLFTYHFTPPNPGEGTDKVDENTVFRIASGSKLFTVLAALLNSDIDFEASVLKYLPELNETAKEDEIFSLKWEDITVGSLASHLSGIGVDLAQDLGIIGSAPWAQMGLPQFAKGEGPTCSGLPGTIPCTKKDLLEQVNLRPPVYGPFTNPVYSNVGIALLGLVVEAAAKKPFAEVLKRDIFDVVGMKNTYVGKTPLLRISLSLRANPHGMPLLPCSTEGILTNKFLSPAQTRKWMKPISNTASWGYQVGAPWEILRGDNITVDGRLIDVYTKSGDLGLYHSQTVLIPDYDIVISIMSGGKEASANQYVTSTVLSSVINALVPAIEKVGRDSAKEAFAGEYADKETNSSISFKVDNGPGLVINSWQIRGFDVLNHIGSYSFDALESGKVEKSKYVDARVYPTNLNKKGQTAWRTVFDMTTSQQDAEYESALFFKDGTCQSWFAQDRKVYDFLPLDEFVFIEGDEGVSTAVRNPAFNVTLTKVREPGAKKAATNAAGQTRELNAALGLGLAVLAAFMSMF
ncbi:hypothetical protein NW754_004139 [Fusarium falciforme]|nr:hypothetical protein NW754_004139 [Fusarium falciforme]